MEVSNFGTYPVKAIKSPVFLPEIDELMRELLARHGASVQREKDYYLITFPEGTYKTEILPRLHDELYKVIFPDGYTLLETITYHLQAMSILQFEVDTLPADIRTRLLLLKNLPPELQDKLQKSGS